MFFLPVDMCIHVETTFKIEQNQTKNVLEGKCLVWFSIIGWLERRALLLKEVIDKVYYKGHIMPMRAQCKDLDMMFKVLTKHKTITNKEFSKASLLSYRLFYKLLTAGIVINQKTCFETEIRITVK